MSLLSALWLVDDSAAVSLRYVLTRDWMTTLMFFSWFLLSSLSSHGDKCALMDIRTSQAIDRSRRHHTLQLTYQFKGGGFRRSGKKRSGRKRKTEEKSEVQKKQLVEKVKKRNDRMHSCGEEERRRERKERQKE